MMRLNPILTAALVLFVGASCQTETRMDSPATGTKEVEIDISTSGSSATRAPLDGATLDTGDANERAIETLDLLVFGEDDKYLYRREAYKLTSGSGNRYRVQLQETDEELTAYLFANSRQIVAAWEAAGEREGQSWAVTQLQLIDDEPERLVWQDDHVALPMFGKVTGEISETQSPTQWGEVLMRRAVASVDLYAAQTPAVVDTFKLKGLLAWYAPTLGYLAEIEDPALTSPQQYKTPAGMTTTLNGVLGGRLHADSVMTYQVVEGSDTKAYAGVAYQIYFYDNNALSTAEPTNRPTRIIVAGEFETSSGVWTPAYYPLDLVKNDGTYRPAIRNWKYEFEVTAVTGPGYESPGDAAVGAPTDLNVKIVEWNKDEVAIGVKGHYYVTMATKNVNLWRYANISETIGLTYEVLDDDPATFDIDFEDDTWGTQTDITNGIENDYFRVVMTQTPATGGGTVSFEVTPLLAMADDEPNRNETVIVRFRELRFPILITQRNSSEEDWQDGGEIPTDL